MNKKQLVAAISAKANMTQKDTERIIGLFLDEICHSLAKGEKVQLIGFGAFETRQRAARTARNPQTGKSITIAACKVPVFKAGKQLKDRVK